MREELGSHSITSVTYNIFCLQERLAHLKRQCQPHLTETAKSSVEGICTKVFNMSVETVKKLNERHWQILNENHINGGYLMYLKKCQKKKKKITIA